MRGAMAEDEVPHGAISTAAIAQAIGAGNRASSTEAATRTSTATTRCGVGDVHSPGLAEFAPAGGVSASSILHPKARDRQSRCCPGATLHRWRSLPERYRPSDRPSATSGRPFGPNGIHPPMVQGPETNDSARALYPDRTSNTPAICAHRREKTAGRVFSCGNRSSVRPSAAKRLREHPGSGLHVAARSGAFLAKSMAPSDGAIAMRHFAGIWVSPRMAIHIELARRHVSSHRNAHALSREPSTFVTAEDGLDSCDFQWTPSLLFKPKQQDAAQWRTNADHTTDLPGGRMRRGMRPDHSMNAARPFDGGTSARCPQYATTGPVPVNWLNLSEALSIPI